MDLRTQTEIGFDAQFDTPVTHVPELPPDLLDTFSIQALTTVAALMCRPNVASNGSVPLFVETFREDGFDIREEASGTHFMSEGSLAIRLLAIYAAGAMVDLTAEQVRELDNKAARFAEKCGHAELAEYVGFVRRRANELAKVIGVRKTRATGDVADSIIKADGKITGWVTPPTAQNADKYRQHTHEIPGGIFDSLQLPPEEARHVTGLARMDLDAARVDLAVGRGYGNVGVGLGPMFDLRPRHMQLLTVAAVFAAAKPSCANKSAEAIVLLALYAAGARMLLTKQQFRTLEDRTRAYAKTMLFGRYRRYPNRDFAMKALFFARLRARRTGVLPSGGRNNRSAKTA